MAIFRLLHVSDLHIARKPERVGLLDFRKAGLRFPRDLPRVARASSYSPDLLDGLIEYVYDQGDRFDMVLISGDLATTGKAEDLDQALSCVDGDDDGLWYSSPHAGRAAVTSHRSLKGAERQILLLPGNHDRYDDSLLLPPGGALFDKYFFHYWEVSQGVKAWISPPKDGTRLGLVCADLSLRRGDLGTGLWDSYGQGKAYADIIDGLETLTEDLLAEFRGLRLLWVVHFPPAYPQIDDSLRLLNDEALIHAAHRKRIPYILAGHTHLQRAYRALSAGSAVQVLCAGTAAQGVAPEGNFIQELEITVAPGGLISESYQSFQWYEEDQKWVRGDLLWSVKRF